jgi:hypothetical protein
VVWGCLFLQVLFVTFGVAKYENVYMAWFFINHQRQSEVSGSHGDEHEDGFFWVVAPCSLVEVYLRFRGACCLHHQRDEYNNPENSHLQLIFVTDMLGVCLRVGNHFFKYYLVQLRASTGSFSSEGNPVDPVHRKHLKAIRTLDQIL